MLYLERAIEMLHGYLFSAFSLFFLSFRCSRPIRRRFGSELAMYLASVHSCLVLRLILITASLFSGFSMIICALSCGRSESGGPWTSRLTRCALLLRSAQRLKRSSQFFQTTTATGCASCSGFILLFRCLGRWASFATGVQSHHLTF